MCAFNTPFLTPSFWGSPGVPITGFARAPFVLKCPKLTLIPFFSHKKKSPYPLFLLQSPEIILFCPGHLSFRTVWTSLAGGGSLSWTPQVWRQRFFTVPQDGGCLLSLEVRIIGNGYGGRFFFLVFVFDSGTLAERRGFRLPGLRWKDQGDSKEVGIGARRWRSVFREMRHLHCAKTYFVVETRPSM